MLSKLPKAGLDFAFDGENAFGLMKMKLFLNFLARLWSEKTAKISCLAESGMRYSKCICRPKGKIQFLLK